ncbi:hypothetical protein [Streptomyces sp. NPDC058758]|uniref:hypothetical protein n=1 Tax=Streptomyces sp. NPDC058758 TaxID=3346627 RepID=UPI0036863D10
MGRKRPNKPRRAKMPRQRGYTLRQLQPPGDCYDEWLSVPANMRFDEITHPEVGEQEIDFLRRAARLGPLYGDEVPMAALVLDTVIDTGHLPVYHDGEEASLLPLQQIVGTAPDLDDQGVRESIHRLHAVGAFLVVSDQENDIALVRFVSRKPDHPGEQWGFMDDKSVSAATTCIPHGIEQLPVEVAGAVMLLRARKSQLQDANPEALLGNRGVETLERAQDLYDKAHASGYVDYKGCDACPTGHLCTREDQAP